MDGRAVRHSLKGDHPRIIPAKVGFIWISGFRGEDLNVTIYQNMPNLHNQYNLAERKHLTEIQGRYFKIIIGM